MTQEETGHLTTTSHKLAGGLALLVLLAAVVPFVVYGVPQLVGGDRSYVVVSGSMEPKISTGDVVIVGAVDPASITTGDVITFSRNQNSDPVTHRVVDVTQTGDGTRTFTTKGDANEEADAQAIPAANVIGRVVLTIPYIGYVVEFGSTYLGFILLVAIPIVLLVANEVLTLVRGEREDDQTATDDGIVADATSDTAFEFTRTDLNLTLVALAVMAVYAAYVSSVLLSALAIMGLVAAVGGFALVAAIRYASPPGEPVLARTETGIALSLRNRIVEGTIPDVIAERPQVTVDSLADLVPMARAVDGWIVADGDRFVLATPDLVYTCQGQVIRTDETTIDPAEDTDRQPATDSLAVDGGQEEADDAA